MSVTLIGMSGAGKSFIGRFVAQRFSIPFMDTDDELEKAHGKTLPELIGEWGDDRFISEEAAHVMARTNERSNMLISTGGSIVYSDAAMRHLRAISTVIYLKAGEEDIVGRVDSARIGRIVRLNGGTLVDLMRAREPLYERYAHLTIATAGKDAAACLKAIVAAICEQCHRPATDSLWVRPKEGGPRKVYFFCAETCRTSGLASYADRGFKETSAVLGWDVFIPRWQREST